MGYMPSRKGWGCFQLRNIHTKFFNNKPIGSNVGTDGQTDMHTHVHAHMHTHMYVHAHSSSSSMVILWSSWYSLSYFLFLRRKLCQKKASCSFSDRFVFTSWSFPSTIMTLTHVGQQKTDWEIYNNHTTDMLCTFQSKKKYLKHTASISSWCYSHFLYDSFIETEK
jgi:hypothetical protein